MKSCTACNFDQCLSASSLKAFVTPSNPKRGITVGAVSHIPHQAAACFDCLEAKAIVKHTSMTAVSSVTSPAEAVKWKFTRLGTHLMKKQDGQDRLRRQDRQDHLCMLQDRYVKGSIFFPRKKIANIRGWIRGLLDLHRWQPVGILPQT